MFGLAVVLLGTTVHGQDADALLGTSTGWQRYDWLKPSDATGAQLTATSGQNISDPFAVVTSGSLWQDKYGATYTQPVINHLALSYETDMVSESDSDALSPGSTDGMADDLSHAQKVSAQFQPFDQLTLRGDVHDTQNDAGSPASSVETRGSGFTAEGHLPFNSVLTLGARSDNINTGQIGQPAQAEDAYDAQLKQPLGKLPLTAVLKGHYEESSSDGSLTARLPSLEQSLVWKPAGSATTLQLGLRQQHYEDFPGVSNELNETVFADWSQSLLPEVTWHSYAEVIDSRITDIAPAAPATSGTNGTPQSADPTNSLGVPTSLSDETVTFSTGPSFKVDRDISASIEYSNRVDPNPLPGTSGPEQRVSVSLKGTF